MSWVPQGALIDRPHQQLPEDMKVMLLAELEEAESKSADLCGEHGL